MQVHARRYDNGLPVCLEWEGAKLVHCATLRQTNAQHAWPWVAPGFWDVQVNGFAGQEFSSPELTPEKVQSIVTKHFDFGVTSICPTLTTQSFAVISHGMKTIAQAAEKWPEVAKMIVGIHLEGPYIATEDGPRGAHPLEHCRPPDWDEFEQLQAASGHRIKIITLSPEYEQAPAFIARASSSGVVVAIGHTGATAEQIQAAVDAGAKFTTHLGNGAHRQLKRHPNYLWDQMAEDRLWASLIVDGHHLPPEVVKCFVRSKTPARCLLVSDESGLAGLPPGRYDSMGGALEILEDGRLVIAGQNQLLAGASQPIGDGVANVMRFAGVDLPTAIHMATTTPAALLNHSHVGLRPGDLADLVLFQLDESSNSNSGALQFQATVAGGKLVYGSLTA